MLFMSCILLPIVMENGTNVRKTKEVNKIQKIVQKLYLTNEPESQDREA